jgi:hypothetical protein
VHISSDFWNFKPLYYRQIEEKKIHQAKLYMGILKLNWEYISVQSRQS